MKRNEESLRHIWDSIEHTNIQMMSQRRKKENEGYEKIFEIIVKSFLNMGEEIDTQVQSIQGPKNDKLKEKHVKNQTKEI